MLSFFRFAPMVMYILSIIAANWAIETFGIVPVGFGLIAPAGVFFAGLTFTFRNLTQQALGRKFGFLAIAIGAIVSYSISSGEIPGGMLPIAAASGLTFLLSETADALVWTWRRKHGEWTKAMLLGDVAGQVIDSVVFITLAFGSPMLAVLLAGQVVGKWYTLLPAVVATKLWVPGTQADSSLVPEYA